MGTKRGGEGRRLKAIRRGLSMESLERRDLLASGSEVFTGPSLTTLITQAEHGKNTSRAQINAMVDALQSQLTAGPVADLTSGAVTADGFISESQALEAGYEQYADQELDAKFPSLDEAIKFQGQRVIDNLVALNQEYSVGLISGDSFGSELLTTIDSLSTGPIFATGTKSSTLIALTKTTETNLTTVTDLYAGGSLTLQQAATTIHAEAEAYRSDIHAALQVTQLKVSGESDAKIDALEQTVVNIETTSPSTASSQLSTAVTTFGDQIGGKTGLIGTNGALVHSRSSSLNSSRSNGQAASVFSSVSGTATVGGTATLTATLTSSDGSPLMGEPVAFTIDGAFAGLGITNFHGVATVANVPSTEAAGTDTDGIIATFRSDTNFLATASPGNVTVAAQPTAVGNVSGTVVFGGTATLTASLSSASGQALAGETLTFTLDGTAVGSAVTNASGVATLSGVATTDSAGTDTGGIVVNFAGASTLAASSNIGNLVVSQSATTLANVAGTAQFGGTAILTATLVSSTTNQGVPGETVSFTLDGASIGTAVTDASGIAELTGVSISEQLGLQAGVVGASFAGDTNYEAATAATGDLNVTQASTALSSVGGTATFGETATLTATLSSLATNSGFADQTVNFTLDGVSVGNAVTNSSGVATLSGVATTAAVGTDSGAVVASFTGNTDYASTTSTGDLVVSQQNTALSDVSGTAEFGGPATLIATLDSTTTSTPLANETVNFTLNGTSVGNAVTNASGVATLTGVSQDAAVGVLSSAVLATFAGDTDYASSSSVSGNLTVTTAPTTLASVSGTAQYGGKATLTATLKSTASGQGVGSEDITFTLNGTSVGSALTNSDGVATLTGVGTGAAVGTDSDVVAANFAGDTDYDAAPGGLGNLVVSPATTSITNISGSSPLGGPADLTATLISAATNAGIVGQTVTFSLDGTVVGTAVTGTGGVANFTVPTITDTDGTHDGAVTVSFASSTDYAASTGSGNLVVNQQATTLGSVSGTASFGGTATLMATLTTSTSSQGIAGQTVSFTLDGTTVGTAVTDGSGVATLTGVATSDDAGTDSGGVVASFAGDADYAAAANASGDLVVTKAATTLGSVSGTASFGGTATLTATLISNVTGLGAASADIQFELDGTLVGTATTNASGVATLTGVPTTDGGGTDTGGVVAIYPGDDHYQATANATGNLVVSQTPTVLGGVSGTASFGGTATLTAVLLSSTSLLGIAGQTVSFTLDGTTVGTAVTDGSGVATLTGVATSDDAGTDSGGVVASFAGDADYAAAANASGDLVVTKAATTLGSVSGTASFGGTATLTATLISNVTGLGAASADIQFELDGTLVGTATTNASGVATLTGVPTTDGGGTDTGGVVAIYPGDDHYQATANATGNLVVSQAATTLMSVSGSSPAGGPATLMATLISTVTGQGISGETISFTLDGVPVGTAVTNASGIATLAGVPTSDPAGTDPGGVVANFGGDVDYEASQGIGDLIVS